MAAIDFSSVLELQEWDMLFDKVNSSLDEIPEALLKCEGLLAAQEARIALQKKSITDLELGARQVEVDIAAAEEQIGKYKNHQLAVKKNDEYKALEKEIEDMGLKIGELEDQGLELMVGIDEAYVVLDELEADVKKEVALINEEISQLQEKQNELKAKIDHIISKRDAALAKVPEALLKEYQYVKSQTKRPPYVVPIQKQQCQGCFIKVATDRFNDARKGDSLVRCDNCSRLIYVN